MIIPVQSISCIDSKLQIGVLLGENRRFRIACTIRSITDCPLS